MEQITTVQDLTNNTDLNAIAQDALNLGTQPQEDAQVMAEQMETQTIQEPIKGSETAGISSWLAKQIAKRKSLATQGVKEYEARQAQAVSSDVALKAETMQEATLEAFEEADVHQVNFDTIQSADDLRKEFAVMNEANKTAILEQRRDIIPDEELSSLADDLSSNPETIKKVLGLKPGEILAPEYILSMKQTLQQSAKRLKDLSQKVVGGEATDADKIAFHKQWEFHSQYTTQFMGVRAEYGRGLRALGIKTEGSGAELTELMNRMSSGTLDERVMAEQILMADDTKSLTRVIDAQKKGLVSKVGDAFSELYISSILSGIQTHVVNTTSNAMKAVSMPLDTAVASMFKADGTDVIGRGEGLAQIKGMMEANIEALDMAWKVLRTGEAYGGVDKLDVDYQKAISANALGIKEGVAGTMVDQFGKFVRLSTDNLMGAEDAYFKVLNERGKLRQLAHRRAVDQNLTGQEYDNYVAMFMDNPPQDAMQQATMAGLEGTYQQPLGKAGRAIQQAREQVWGGKFIMPFIKTPINLIYEGFIERTPLGLVSQKYKQAMLEGGAKAQMAKAKMTVGTSVNSALLATFYNAEYGSGNNIEVIGSYPSDPKLRQSMKDAGVQENSIAFTDENGKKTYTSFDRLEPFNSVFKLYANIMQVQKIANLNEMNPDAEKEFNKMAAGMSLAFAEATVNQTFMRGIKDLMDAMTAGTNVKRIESLVANYANAMIPHSSALRNITKVFDEQMRDADGITDRIRKNLPTLGKDQPPILDNFGKPLTYENNLTPAFYKPGKEGSNDFVRNEVHRVSEATKTVPVFKPKKNFSGYVMTPKEYYDYTYMATHDRIDGKTFYESIKKTMGTIEYKIANDHKRALYINSLREAYYGAAKAKLKIKYPHINKYDIDKEEYKKKLLQGEF